MRAEFGKIGVKAGKPFAADKLTPEEKTALESGMKSGIEKIKQKVGDLGKYENGWRVMTNGFGDRQAYAGEFHAPGCSRNGGNLWQ